MPEAPRIYFRQHILPEHLPLIENDASLLSRRHVALFMCALQIVADLAAMGLAGVRGQIFVLVAFNLILICAAIGGVYGSATVAPYWSWGHAVVSFMLSLMLIGVGVADVFLEETQRFLRLATLFPVVVDIAAGIASFRFSSAAISAVDRREAAVEDRFAEQQALRKQQFERDQENRHKVRTERAERAAAREDAEAEGSSSSESILATRECVVCLASPKNAILMPCHHICTCISCAAKLKTCPLCRADIERAEKVFL